jgi:hypothetical protein
MTPADEGRQVQVAEGARCLGLCEQYGKVPSKGGGWRGEEGFNHASLQIHAWFQSCGHFRVSLETKHEGLRLKLRASDSIGAWFQTGRQL